MFQTQSSRVIWAFGYHSDDLDTIRIKYNTNALEYLESTAVIQGIYAAGAMKKDSQ